MRLNDRQYHALSILQKRLTFKLGVVPKIDLLWAYKINHE